MSNQAKEIKEELPLDALLLQCENDRYKIAYAALRWAKEIKQKENLPEPIPLLIPRSMRELLTGKVTLKEIEKLPVVVKVSSGPPVSSASPSPSQTIILKESSDSPAEPIVDVKSELKPEAKPLVEAEVTEEPTEEPKPEPAVEPEEKAEE